MRKFIDNLPNNPIEEKIKIAFWHFMSGTKMYSKEGYEITTQYGFKHVALHEFNSKLTEKSLDKYIVKYNEENITPTKYRELARRYQDHLDKEFKADLKRELKRKHPLKYAYRYIKHKLS